MSMLIDAGKTTEVPLPNVVGAACDRPAGQAGDLLPAVYSRIRPRLGHIPALDGVRGLAILMVLATHTISVFGDPFGNNWVTKTLRFGHTGVDLFFVLSGFLITCILLDTRRHRGYLRSFLIRRGLRIYPLYFAVLAFVILILGPLAIRSSVRDYALWHRGWTWNALFATNFFLAKTGGWVCATTDITWSVCIEEQFYIVWPFVVLVLGSRRLLVLTVILVLVATISRAVVGANGGNIWLTAYMLPWCRVDSLAVGAFIATAFGPPSGSGTRANRRLFTASLLSLALIMLCAASTLQGAAYVTWSFLGHSLAYGLLLSAVLYSGSGLLVRVMVFPPLRYLGRISYGLYLTHLIVGYGTRALLSRYVSNPLAMYFIGGTLLMIGSVGIASLSWFLFESRVLKLAHYVPRPDDRSRDRTLAMAAADR